MNDTQTSLPEGVRLPFEANSHAITPFFKHMSVLSRPDTETRGELVYDLKEMVELRFAGDRNYSPCFEVNEMWRKIDGRVVTFAERFAEQYRAFVLGETQVAGGTALEMLKPYGMTPAQISLCNALKVYSIEAILEMKNPNALGMSTNLIMGMARRWQADHDEKSRAETTDRVAALEAEIARLRTAIPTQEAAAEDIDAALHAADDEYAALSSDDLKERIKGKIGHRPAGNPSRETLVQSLKELDAA